MDRRTFVRNTAALAAGGVILGPTQRALAAPGEFVAVPRDLAPVALPSSLVTRTLPSGRTYLVQPRAASTPGPVVFGFHGSAHDASNAEATFWVVPGDAAASGWSKHAALRDYTLVLGNGLSGRWNVGNGWPGGTQDDDAYALAVVDFVLASQPNADPAQVFAAGFSAGAAMAWRLAALYPDVFAACASFSGWAPVYPAQPIDAYRCHGTADTTVPILGGVGGSSYNFPPLEDEFRKSPRGSRIVLHPTAGGHVTPGWAAQRILDFWLVDRKRP
jgi:predicted esterase